jgi:hypothetical protein
MSKFEEIPDHDVLLRMLEFERPDSKHWTAYLSLLLGSVVQKADRLEARVEELEQHVAHLKRTAAVAPPASPAAVATPPAAAPAAAAAGAAVAASAGASSSAVPASAAAAAGARVNPVYRGVEPLAYNYGGGGERCQNCGRSLGNDVGNFCSKACRAAAYS